MVENIKAPRSNFCKGPQVGTYCTVDNFNTPVTMQVRNTSGVVVRPYTFNPTSIFEAAPYLYSASDGYISGSIISLKSLIIDIEDCWRTNYYMVIRSIELYDANDQLITLGSSDFSATATSYNSSSYAPWRAFNTAYSKTNSWQYTSWLSSWAVTNQRLICVLEEETEVKKIVINNGHHYGGSLDYGIKNIKMYYSTTDITNTTYAADIPDYVLIFSGQIPQHIAANTIDDYEPPLGGGTVGAHNEFMEIKYIGPYNQSSYYDGATFYTLERVGTGNRTYYSYERDPEITGDYKRINDNLVTAQETEYNGNIIRRWKVDAPNFRLNLDSSYYLSSDASYWFDGQSFAIENIKTELAWHVPIGTGTLELTTTSGLAKYDKILIGPSSDVTNLGAVEEVYVHSIVDSTNILIKTYNGYTPTKYEYIVGDPLTIFKNMKLFSNAKPLINADNIRYGFERDEGTLYHLTHQNYGEVVDVDYNGIYSDVTVSTWNDYFNTLSFVKGINLLHLNTIDHVLVKSQDLALVEPNKEDYIPIYDIVIDGVDVYKLQKELLQRNDTGLLTLEEWTTWNYSTDSLEPYTNSVTISNEYNTFLYQQSTIVTAIVRDQYGVGLLGKNILFSSEGDIGGIFIPDDGIAVTDSNGVCSIQYIAGATFKGNTIIKVRAEGGNTVHGSVYIVCETSVPTYPDYLTEHRLLSINSMVEDQNHIMSAAGSVTKESALLCFVRRSFPGGEWVWKGTWPYPDITNPTIDDRNEVLRLNETSVLTTVYQPFFNQLEVMYVNGTLVVLNSVVADYSNVYVTQLDSFYSEYNTNISSISEASDHRFISQNYLSRHLPSGHIISSTINQYVFIQEAIPKFWSEKNATSITYWIRLRPFSASLDPTSLQILIYEKSYLGVTDTIDIVPTGTITPFDAGGGLEGIDFSYIFPNDFHHNAIVYIEARVRDQTPIPNLLVINYWFKIIADYRAPYFINQQPTIEEADVNIDALITFDVLDIGSGVDISTLEVYINNQRVGFTFVEYEYGQYNVECILSNNFHHGQQINVSVSVRDRSDNVNLIRDGWQFYCANSTGPWFDMDEVSPGKCLEGVDRTSNDVSLQVYGINDAGVDYGSLKLEVGGKYRNIKITPIIYRLK